MFGAPNTRSDGRVGGVAARDRGDVVGDSGEGNDASGVEGVRARYRADFFRSGCRRRLGGVCGPF
jgi:hypothetical protein